jgi:hypothetical protein
MYFGTPTHNAIIDYQKEPENDKKNEIYTDRIRPAFNKLVENLIFIHGFHNGITPYEILKAECVCFLFESLNKFDASKGSKAFSYFNVVAKHWLIIRSKKEKKERITKLSIHATDSMSARDKRTVETYRAESSQETKIIIKESKDELFEIFEKISKKLTGENEQTCIAAIKKIFTDVDEIELFNKRAVFVYLREISNLNSKQLSISLSNIRKHFREIVKDEDIVLILGE